MNKIIIDPELKNLIPPLTQEEFESLKESILTEGIRDKIIFWIDKDREKEESYVIVDGHNRYEILKKYKKMTDLEILKLHTTYKSFRNKDDVKEWMIKNQLARRNITAFQRAELALKLKPVIAEKAKENMSEGGKQGLQKSVNLNTQKEIAKSAGVSHDTIHKAETILNKADSETVEAVRKGDKSINQAYNEIKAKQAREYKNRYEAEVNEAKERHEALKEKDVISISDIKQDKEDKELIQEHEEEQAYDIISYALNPFLRFIRNYSACGLPELLKQITDKDTQDSIRVKASLIRNFILEFEGSIQDTWED